MVSAGRPIQPARDVVPFVAPDIAAALVRLDAIGAGQCYVALPEQIATRTATRMRDAGMVHTCQGRQTAGGGVLLMLTEQGVRLASVAVRRLALHGGGNVIADGFTL